MERRQQLCVILLYFLWQLPQMQDVDSICISRQCLNRRNVSENTDYDGTYCGQPDKSDD